MNFPDLSQAPIISVDIETYDPGLAAGVGPGELRGGFIAGIALATQDGFAEYYPIAHEQGENLDKQKVLAYMSEQLNRPDQCKLGTNICYDVSYLVEAGVKVSGRLYDISLAQGLLDENKAINSLESLAQHYLGKSKEDELLYDYCAKTFGGQPTRKQQAGRIWRAPSEFVRDYAIADAKLPLEIYAIQRTLLQQEELVELFNLETDLLYMLMAMRKRGVAIDIQKIERIKETMAVDIKRLTAEIKGEFGKDINLNSTKQLGEVLDCLDLQERNYTKTGALSTGADALAAMGLPITEKLVQLRKMQKIVGTYLNSYLNDYQINSRLHCSLHSWKSERGGTVTGRFSSSHPNLQNVPKRDKAYGKEIRSIFVPDGDDVWHCDDGSQMEFRLLVHYARGESAEKARRAYCDSRNTDFHNYTHDIIFEKTGIDLPRAYVKNINFGVIFGMGIKKMAKDLKVTVEKAKEIMQTYNSALPFVKETARIIQRVADNRGYIKSMLKRRRRFDLWEPRDYEEYGPALPLAEAQATYTRGIRRAKTKDGLNFATQGGCADWMKLCMLRIWQSGVCDVLGPPLNSVHDELNWSVPRTAEGVEAHAEAVRIMETCMPLRVPLLVNSAKGANWGDLE